MKKSLQRNQSELSLNQLYKPSGSYQDYFLSQNKIKFRHSFVSAQIFGLPSSTGPLGFPNKVCDRYSERLISDRIKRSKNAIHNAVVTFKKTGTYLDAKRSGSPRKSTQRDEHIIRRTAVWSPMSSASKIRSVGLLLAKGANISRRTVSRRLVIDFGLKACKLVKKPRLTPAMKAKRLRFVKKHAKWTIQQWQQVFFSDESTVQQFTTRKRYVRRPNGKQFDEQYTTQTMKRPQVS